MDRAAADRCGLAAILATETAEALLWRAGVAADQIERGIAALADDGDALDAFRVANRTVARALRRRLGIDAPRWHAFQLPSSCSTCRGSSIREVRSATRWTCSSSRPAHC